MKKALIGFIILILLTSTVVYGQSQSIKVNSQPTEKISNFINCFKNDCIEKFLSNFGLLKQENVLEEELTQEIMEEEILNEIKTITMSFAGDFTLGKDATTKAYNTFDRKYAEVGKDPSYFLKNVKHLFENDDITFVNLETTLTNATKYANKKFRFKGIPDYRHILKEGSVDVVSLANNHTMDYHQQGYEDTKTSLGLSNIGFVDDNVSIMKEVDGIKVGIMGFKGWDSGKITKDNMKKHIDKLKNDGADILVIMFHWGNESQHYPIQTQTNLAHFAIDNGVDLVVGGHAHVLQSMEMYKNKPIVYGLGNFCYGGHSNPADKDTMVFQQTFTFVNGVKQDVIDAKVIPCSISSDNSTNNFQPTPLTGDNFTKVIGRLRKYSEGNKIKILDDGTISK